MPRGPILLTARQSPCRASSAALAFFAVAVGCGRPEGKVLDSTSAKGGDTATLAGALPDRGVATTRPGEEPRIPGRDWAAIARRDTLVVGAAYNSTTYFIYKGEPLGFEYELLKAFAADHDVALRLVVTQQRDSLIALLGDGRADVIAARLVPIAEDSGRVAWSHALYRDEPVLVQRQGAPTGATAAERTPADSAIGVTTPVAKARALRARLVRTPAELAGARVTIPRQSPYEQTLIELSDTISGDIQVVEVDATAEALVRAVARGDVAYTVTEQDLAKLQGASFRNLVVQPVVGEPRKVAWGVRPNARALRDTLDAWIAGERGRASFASLYRKYYVDARGYQTRVASRYLTSRTGRLSPYDSLFKSYAPSLGWDWRLLGSQAYQESKFRPDARSWVGARGLMQLMPATARQFRVKAIANPRENVAGGVAYLKWLQKYWAARVPDEDERLRFILASYNAGAGHVEDAQRIAEKRGDDPRKWESVAYWLLQLSKAEFYGDSVVRYGYVRGLEPVTYVSLILDRFEHYKQFVDPRGSTALEPPPGRPAIVPRRDVAR